jgi:hypothetical protein
MEQIKPIQFVQVRQTKKHIEHKNAFEYNKNLGINWLQKLCFWYLKKIKAFHYSEVIDVHTVTPNQQQKIFDLVRDQINSCYRLTGKSATTLYIGLDDIHDVLDDASIKWYAQFPIKSRVSFNGEYPNIMGLNVVVIPWMNGVLVV